MSTVVFFEPFRAAGVLLYMFSDFWQDVRYAARGFHRSKAFTAAGVLAIALGIGVNTGIFSILNGLALRNLPVPDAGKLVSIPPAV